MHIAFLTPEYPHSRLKHAGGLGTSIKNLVEALVLQKVKVTVFVYGQDRSTVFDENGVFFHVIQVKKAPFFQWFFYRKHIQNYVNTIIDKESIELIEAPDWTGITAFMKFSVPLIIRFHGSDTYFCSIENRKQKLKNRLFETLAVKNAQGYIAPTQFAGDKSAELFGIAPSNVKTIHYGLNLDEFVNKEPEVFEKGLIVYVGTIIRKKGVFDLPQIFSRVRKQVPDCKLVLIGGDSPDVKTGNGSTWSLIEKEFKAEDKEKVTYLGKIPYVEVQNYIKKANVCVFPTYAETLGMVTIESMAMHKPVVNSSIGWAQELIIDEESGFLVYPSDHEKYSDRIIDVLNDSELTLNIGASARKRTEKFFDIKKKVEENILFYKHIQSKI